jgi:hypothetical protein
VFSFPETSPRELLFLVKKKEERVAISDWIQQLERHGITIQSLLCFITRSAFGSRGPVLLPSFKKKLVIKYSEK